MCRASCHQTPIFPYRGRARQTNLSSVWQLPVSTTLTNLTLSSSDEDSRRFSLPLFLPSPLVQQQSGSIVSSGAPPAGVLHALRQHRETCKCGQQMSLPVYRKLHVTVRTKRHPLYLLSFHPSHRLLESSL